ncbi:hypothetical protein HN51_044579 [Arachis hypogaea]|uniref:uncharacterized protein LOC107614125 n=1 Tax=Arachis ipaensis TaxID=130454 RepID=UPI000A2B0186|nr:uncharacterized protein LOC107614125 [Arachis ipaensis]
MQMTTNLLLKLRFKEQIGDVLAARAAYIQQTGKESDSDFVQNVISRANMEKRLGNMESACGIYKEAIEMVVAEENLQHALPNLYVHFSHLKYMVEKNSKNPILLSGCKVADGSDVLLSFAMCVCVCLYIDCHVCVLLFLKFLSSFMN